ncbi:MAG: hypothetical protein AAGJ46_09890 [Planctomycetota bacterium]
MNEAPPAETFSSRPPLDEAGAGPRWIVVAFFLQAAAGVASLRVLVLAAAGLVLAEGVGGVLSPPVWDTTINAEARSLEPSSLWRQFEESWSQQVGLPRSIATPLAASPLLTKSDLWSIAAGVWRLVVWGLFGSAIALVAASHMAFADRPTLTTAMRHAAAQWSSLVAGPTVLLTLAGVGATIVWLAGYVSRVELLGWPIALLWPVVGLVALASGLCLIAAVAGAPFFWAAWAVDRADGFDAVSTGVAYLYQRPLRLAAYSLQAMAVGAAAGVLVAGVAGVVLAACEVWFAGLNQGAGASTPASIASFWYDLLASAPAVFHAAYFWFAAVGVYLLMRRDIDEKQCDEIYVEGNSPSPDAA